MPKSEIKFSDLALLTYFFYQENYFLKVDQREFYNAFCIIGGHKGEAYNFEPETEVFPMNDSLVFFDSAGRGVQVGRSGEAKTLDELITAKQLGLIRGIARRIKVNEEVECKKLFNIKTDQLSKKAASTLIQYLQELERDFKNNNQIEDF